MIASRRRLFQYFAVSAAGSHAAEISAPATIDSLRAVSQAHGTKLSEQRLNVLKPVLEQRKVQIQALREFEIDDSVAPTQSIAEPNHGGK